jgi:membrane protease YdiL (CAAX protease family)
MNHLESSFSGKNSPWRYIVMFIAVLIASNTIGAIPLLIAYIGKAASDPEVISKIAADPNDLGVLGLEPNLGFFMMLFPFLIGLAAFMLLVKPLNSRTFKMTINGTGVFRWNRLFTSGLVWLILSAVYFFIYLKADPSNFTLKNTSGTLILLVIVSLIFVPFQAAFEEVLFRGYLMQGSAVLTRNRWLPILITSVLFGLMHAFNPEVEEFGFFTMMPQYILFGLIFGIITVLDDGIEAALGAHAANNIFLCIMVTHQSSALQTPAIYEQQNVYPWTEFAALLITGIIFIMVLKAIFKWDSYSLLLGRVEPKPQTDQSPYTDVISSVR